jgi:glutamyl-tRNA(Gln) amidotransferase subunit E
VFAYLNDGNISKEAVLEIMVEFAKNKSMDLSRFRKMSDEELEESIRTIVDKNKSLPFNALIGKVMNALRGKADGKKIAEVTKKLSSQN